MKPEVLLKAFVLHQSEDGFRELVAGTVDEVYSRALRIIGGPPHLVEEAVLRAYWELARQAPRLCDHIVVAEWLREHVCKTALAVMHEEELVVDRAAIEEEKEAPASPSDTQAAPPGLAIRISQGILINTAGSKSLWLSLPRFAWPAWIRPVHIGGGVLCVLVLMVLWSHPFHKRNPIVLAPKMTLQMTPASFAQLATPEEAVPAPPSPAANTNVAFNPTSR